MNYKKRKKILSIFFKNNPSPTTELNYSTPFELLIAVMLSAQATDVSVNKATHDLYKIANTPKMIVKMGETQLKKHIKHIGLFNIKAKNIVKTSLMLLNLYNSSVPEKREHLENLPGVGRKTANIILNIIYKHNVIAVDRHVLRVCNRTNFARGITPNIIERKLNKLVQKKFKKLVHFWFVLHGRYICIAKNPKCNICLIRKYCEFKYKCKI